MGKHKGFAYVEMKELEVINNCLLFNNVVPEFQKFPILVKGSEAEKNLVPTKEKLNQDGTVPEARVYIGNLHPSIKQEDIYAILAEFGRVEFVNLHKDELGNSKGFAFGRYSKPEEAQLAMEKLNGLVIGEKAIKVAPVIDPATKQANLAAAALSTNAQGAISGLAAVPGLAIAGDGVSLQTGWKLDEDDAGMSLNANTRATLMAKLGKSAGIEVPVIPTMQVQPTIPHLSQLGGAIGALGNPSRCFVIQGMFNPVEEQRLHGDGWELEIKEDVSEECGKFGAVEFCFVESRKPGGMVFLKFVNQESAVKAAASLNGRFFAGNQIQVKYLDPKEFENMCA